MREALEGSDGFDDFEQCLKENKSRYGVKGPLTSSGTSSDSLSRDGRIVTIWSTIAVSRIAVLKYNFRTTAVDFAISSLHQS